ncbi:hypothetical protein [Rhodocista pekingensis]|uniref:Uncharacterized protein n=1 Tax=Rhodocista pekingensis TaxID=201185 RepID=A0ABW2KZG3_9PROT
MPPALPVPPADAPGGPPFPAPLRALVVFCDGRQPRWVRLLRPGFRHVFVALCDGAHWVTLDPLSPRTEVAVQPVPAAFDLAGWFRDHGLTVLEATPAVPARPAPPAPFTCVEAVKRVLGLHAPWVLTPWQLYRRLSGPPNPCPPNPCPPSPCPPRP